MFEACMQNCLFSKGDDHQALQSNLHGCPGKHACPKVQQSWYDEECKVARTSMKHLVPGTPEHSATGKAYKALLRRKRRAWQHQAQHSLCELASRNPQAFWKHYKKRESEANSISRQAWQESFEGLYKVDNVTSASAPEQSAGFSTVNPIQTETPCPTPPPPDTPSEQHFDFLNADITCEEVCAAFRAKLTPEAADTKQGGRCGWHQS